MKRQNVRKLILLVSLLLLPVTLFYFSPVLIIEGAAVGVVTGSAMMFLLLFISGMIFGRGACGWIMACGGFQEMLAGVNDNPLKAEKKKWIRWMIWGSWFTGVITVIITFGAHDFKPFFHDQLRGVCRSTMGVHHLLCCTACNRRGGAGDRSPGVLRLRLLDESVYGSGKKVC